MRNKKNIILLALVQYDINIDEIKNKVSNLSWDSNEEVVVLKKENILNILNIFLEKNITSSGLEEWANLIEGREDIGREMQFIDFIDNIIFSLANPVLAFNDGEINDANVIELLNK